MMFNQTSGGVGPRDAGAITGGSAPDYLGEAGGSTLTQKLRPETLLPPYGLLQRDKAEGIKKTLAFPKSPAFVNVRGARGKEAPQLPNALDFCRKRNIPFNHEEYNYYRLKQGQATYKSYVHSVNACFETSRPTQFATGVSVLADQAGGPPPHQVSKQFTDCRLYLPSTAGKPLAALKKELDGLGLGDSTPRLKPAGGKTVPTTKAKATRNKSETLRTAGTRGGLGQQSTGQYGMLLNQDSSFAGSLSPKQKVGLHRAAEKEKAKILKELGRKLANPAPVAARDGRFRTVADDGGPRPGPSDRDGQVAGILPEGMRVGRRTRADPVYKVLKVNQRDYHFKREMNEKLLKILERYELDKPILMQDKLDAIWDKAEPPQAAPQPGERRSAAQAPPLTPANPALEMVGGDRRAKAEARFAVRFEKPSRFADAGTEATDSTVVMGITKAAADAAAAAKRADNVNQYAVKAKLGQRKVERSAINQRQAYAYNVLLDYLARRQALPVGIKEEQGRVYIKPEEVEREFLDALGIIVQSGYYLDQADFFDLLDILQVSSHTALVHGRAKLYEFFQLAAEVLEFDVPLLEEVLTEPWNIEAEMLHSRSLGGSDDYLGLNTQSRLDAGESLYSAGAVAAAGGFSKTFQNANLMDDGPYPTHDSTIAIRETGDD